MLAQMTGTCQYQFSTSLMQEKGDFSADDVLPA
jgi:hypothetical protein